jgi:hypothetical protein
MEMLKRNNLRTIIAALQNQIFHVSWYKRDGTLRTANARARVLKGIKGTGRRVKQDSNNYLSIYLMGNETGYRTLNLDTVQNIRCYGITADVQD